MSFAAVYQNHRPISKFLILLSLFLTGFGITTILGYLLIQPLFGLDVLHHPELLTDFSNPENIGMMKFMQFMNSLGIFVLPPLVFAYLVSRSWKSYLHLDLAPTILLSASVVLLMFMSQPWINFLVEWNESMQLPEFLASIEQWMRNKEDNAMEITESFLLMETGSDFMINLLVVGLLPAVGEELLFRGLIQTKIAQKTKNAHVGIWVSAFLFSAIHLQFYGFIPRMLLGALFGYLLIWSGSLWLPILAHFVNNAGAVTIQYIFGKEFTESNIDEIGASGEDWMYLLFSGIIIMTILTHIYKTGKVRT